MKNTYPFFILCLFFVCSAYADGESKEDVDIDIDFDDKTINVLDSRIQYREGGKGDTVLFIHGTPSSTDLWRNFLSETAKTHHVIALDLIGHGHSGKPFMEYRINDHLANLQAFIEKLGLKNITLMLNDWGSAIGFMYASRHPENIKAIVFMEALKGPLPNVAFMPEITMQKRGPDS